MSDAAQLEIRALAKIMDELDYYQLFQLKPGATTAEIRAAYHAFSRTYHPDRNREMPPDLHAECERISKRLTEAYCVLRSPRQRKTYDEKLADGSLRLQLAEARAEKTKPASDERAARTSQGRQYVQKATDAEKRGDLAGAIQNLQMALTLESGNKPLAEWLNELKQRKKQKR